jgi:transposase
MSAESRVAKRRFRSKQERRRIAEESLEFGTSVAVVARSHGVNANQVFLWRKLLREGRLDLKVASSTQLTPVSIAEVIGDGNGHARAYPRAIDIELGRIRMRVEGSVPIQCDRASVRSLRGPVDHRDT